MKQFQKLQDEEALILKKINQSILICFGYFMKNLRYVSPMSHEDLEMCSSINSSTAQKVEKNPNFEIRTCIQILYSRFNSIKCKFNLLNLSKLVNESLNNGNCIVILSVKSSELHKYKPEQILFSQDSDDTEELENRAKRRKAKTEKAHKMHKASVAKRNASINPKTKKKKTKK